jgi:hypothetical protein
MNECMYIYTVNRIFYVSLCVSLLLLLLFLVALIAIHFMYMNN